MVVQNNAEARATGGFIGSYALITARDGKLDVGDIPTKEESVAQAKSLFEQPAPALWDEIPAASPFAPAEPPENGDAKPRRNKPSSVPPPAE